MALSGLLKSTVIALAYSNCAANTNELFFKATLFEDINISKRAEPSCDASKQTLEFLLSEFWNSGFVVNSDNIEREILDNHYGIFKAEDAPNFCKNSCFGLYLRNKQTGNEYVLFKESVFCQNMEGNMKMLHRYMPSPSEDLVHELFHDFWRNFIDDKTKSEFADASEQFYTRIKSANTDEQKLALLSEVGIVNPSVSDFGRTLGKLARLKKAYDSYGDSIDEGYFGPELFSLFAENSYMNKFNIPLELRKFYSGIITESAMKKRF